MVHVPDGYARSQHRWNSTCQMCGRRRRPCRLRPNKPRRSTHGLRTSPFRPRPTPPRSSLSSGRPGSNRSQNEATRPRRFSSNDPTTRAGQNDMQRSLQLTTFLFSLSALAPAALAQISPSAEQVRQQDALRSGIVIFRRHSELRLRPAARDHGARAKIRLDPAALKQAKKVAPAAPINQIGNMHALATANDRCRTRRITTRSTAVPFKLPAVR